MLFKLEILSEKLAEQDFSPDPKLKENEEADGEIKEVNDGNKSLSDDTSQDSDDQILKP
jgi:hypothetical protein